MKVFMLGWEFPPFISGGLGTACHGLTKGLDAIGVEVTFVLPTAVPLETGSHVTLRTPADHPAGVAGVRETAEGTAIEDVGTEAFEHLQIRRVPATLQAYGTPASFAEAIARTTIAGAVPAATQGPGPTTPDTPDTPRTETAAVPEQATKAPGEGDTFVNTGAGAHYAGDLMDQVRRYARLASQIAMREEFDVVHAHDWMTYPAGLAVAGITGKPLVVHVHSTEFDRSGENVNQAVYNIERAGMHGADRAVCVSNLTRNIVLNRYSVPPDKVSVVYNAVEDLNGTPTGPSSPIRKNEKIVLFLGRITMQKGPEYFLAAAKKVLAKEPNVRFVMAGSGDMVRGTIELAAKMGIGQKVAFTGFLRGADVDRVFEMADLYVMPSVSEPFGIAPLEALSHNVPVIISKQSGVSEVLTHVLKVDFWDIGEMANKIVAVLRHPPLHRVLREQGSFELRKMSWKDSAARCKQVYESVLG